MSTDRLAPAKRTRALNRGEQNVNRSVGALTPRAYAGGTSRVAHATQLRHSVVPLRFAFGASFLPCSGAWKTIL